ncbi:MAG TPA: hypothetical protein DC049_18340, partial [Spirochaetia bacterium]|nr:hypothetical protein [Spirochaetia bacterium]
MKATGILYIFFSSMLVLSAESGVLYKWTFPPGAETISNMYLHCQNNIEVIKKCESGEGLSYLKIIMQKQAESPKQNFSQLVFGYTNTLCKGHKIRVSFKAKSDSKINLTVCSIMSQAPYSSIGGSASSLLLNFEKEWKAYSYEFILNSNYNSVKIADFFLGLLPQGSALYINSLTVEDSTISEENDSKYKNIPDHFIDLSSVANMGFADEKAGDGIGGWSDQGSDNDFRTFDIRQTNFGGMEFRIPDP